MGSPSKFASDVPTSRIGIDSRYCLQNALIHIARRKRSTKEVLIHGGALASKSIRFT